MVQTLASQINSLLNNYCCSAEGVIGAGISTPSGLEISSNFNGSLKANTIHAVSSSLYNQSMNSTTRLGFKGFRSNLIYTDDGIIALQKVNNNAVVVVMMEPHANVGLALIELDDFVNKIRSLI